MQITPLWASGLRLKIPDPQDPRHRLDLQTKNQTNTGPSGSQGVIHLTEP